MIIRAGSRTVFRRSLLHALAFSPFPCRNASQGSGTSAAAAPSSSSCPARWKQAAPHPSNRMAFRLLPTSYISFPLRSNTPHRAEPILKTRIL
ncbi:hypothetical protein CUC01_11220 [Akkermansia muciniphila]|nr:hypothetical protein CUB96_08150 [Akkermansia muciniphila]AYR33601.1 hypothetical protein CUC01_11220 [Akkermansia muciniphila]MCO6192007.1 hypothetical protein [Akkermansia muciniphila]MCO6193922.1 hypothetical protein [Akkermansia muciniphila]MCO6195869.1 hypothetical protein [Akkermansia muciniphila]